MLAKCQACHGEKGAGKPNDALVGGIGTLAPDKPPVKTVGSYWPYATTLFDYVRRAMPFNEPKSLTDDEVYAVSAYILHLNGIIGAERRARRAVAAEGEDAEPRRVHSVPAPAVVSAAVRHFVRRIVELEARPAFELALRVLARGGVDGVLAGLAQKLRLDDIRRARA